ncbi:MAG: Mov34/MPN/PAD-1 family protein [Clostridia bacterium]|nr:Mov34/MPN/PAD-1 family protein [Clostridia bacterium]
MKVIFSDRAYTALLAETYEKITTETGGIFLGYYEDETWYIVETIDPGPHSIFEVAYFEYDQKYVTHLINKIARLYKKDLSLLGLWHRHPGSFDIFSSTDDGTNHTYAKMYPQGAISALVNIDPEFRLTVYHVPKDLRYKKIPYEVGDEYFPEGVLSLLTKEELLKHINDYDKFKRGRNLQVRLVPEVTFADIMDSVSRSLEEIDDGIKYKEEMYAEAAKEDFIDRVSGEIVEDLDYLADKAELTLNIEMTKHFLCLYDGSKEKNVTKVFFSYVNSIEKFVFIYKNKCYEYESGLFARIIEEGVNSDDSQSFFDKIKKLFGIKRR